MLTLFEHLLHVIAESPQAALVEVKLGRCHPYLPDDKQTRFAGRLRNVVV